MHKLTILFSIIAYQFACNLPSANKLSPDSIFQGREISEKEEVIPVAKPDEIKPINIIPLPVSLTKKEGVFSITSKTLLQFPINADWQTAVAFLQQKLKKAAGFELPITGESKKQLIVFQEEKTFKNPEAYSLDVSKNQITIKAASAKGAFYAIQSLLQLMPNAIENDKISDANWTVPCCTIWDEPRYTWRGMHLDVGRHFFTIDFIKKYIDLMAMHKFNRFHWHLTDDQGWRIEIKKYPRLTEIGGYRNGTIVGKKSSGVQEYYDGQRYGGFYTQEQIKEVVQYASDRFITVVPEIEMPGHCLSALAAYPELACEQGPFTTATKWGGFRPVFCPKEETFTFLENVLTEVIALFPSEYVHLGGDEVKKESWEDSEFCQDLMKKERLDNEMELQSYFMRRMERFLNSKGKKMIGWDEILEGGLTDNATVMSWRGEDGGIEAARAKHNVIMTPDIFCYFNFYQVADKEKEPLAMGKMLSVRKVYSYNPTPEELLPEDEKYILGAQGNVWTEYMPHPSMVEYMVFPRAIALSEVVWTPQEQRIWQDFKPRLAEHLKRLDILGVNYAKHIIK
jgi:hexosaminidase